MSNTYLFHLLNETQLYQPGTNNPDPNYTSQQWHDAIDKLIAHRYSFLPEIYSTDGFIFRGMSSGLKTALKNKSFGHFTSSNELAMVEQVMNVYFFTHELSDALTVARLFEKSDDDSAVIVMSAKYYVDAFLRYEAAMLAIGDFGFVFRYPFLCSPTDINNIAYILYKAEQLNTEEYSQDIKAKLIPIAGNERKQSEKDILHFLDTKQIKAATIEKTPIYPRII